jgi:hypothetical protein
MRYRQRVTRLEAYRRRRLPPSHFVSSVYVPWDLPSGMDQETWLRTDVSCACGQRGCPKLRIGVVLPEKASSAEAWAQRARDYYMQRRTSNA